MLINQIVTLIGDYQNAGRYRLEGNTIFRDEQLIGTYQIESSILKVSCIDGRVMEANMNSGKQLLKG